VRHFDSPQIAAQSEPPMPFFLSIKACASIYSPLSDFL